MRRCLEVRGLIVIGVSSKLQQDARSSHITEIVLMYSFPFGLQEVNGSRYEFGPHFAVLRDTESPFGTVPNLVGGSLNPRPMHNRASALTKERLVGLQIKVEALLLQSETCNETS